jgi:hypothetical protein
MTLLGWIAFAVVATVMAILSDRADDAERKNKQLEADLDAANKRLQGRPRSRMD